MAVSVGDTIPDVEVRTMTGGHLLHEESPGAVANLICGWARAKGVLPPRA